MRRPSKAALFLVALAFGAGALLRLGLALPEHALLAESDSIVAGLAALEVLDGEMPVFNVGYRNGALPGYFLAVLFGLFGASRATLALGPFLVGCAMMWVWYRLTQRVVDGTTARLALAFIAIPGGAYLFWTSLPNTYPESMLLCAAILLLAVRSDISRRSVPGDFAFGFAAGLGFWNSPLTLSCSLPAAVWCLFRDPSRLRRPRQIVAATAGGLLGASPWILFNVANGFPSLHRNFAARSVGGLDGLLENAQSLVIHRIPGLLAQTEGAIRPAEAASLCWLTWPVLGLHMVAAALFLRLTLASGPTKREGDAAADADASPEPSLHRPVAGLFVMVAVFTLLLNLGSFAGSVPGPTSRYLLPVYLLVPAALALLIRRLAARSRVAAAVVVLALLSYHVAGAYLPWTGKRRVLHEQVVKDEALVERLRQEGVDAVLGNYWTVYPINFHTEMEILALPLSHRQDLRKVVRRLRDGGEVQWALVSRGRERRRFRRWLRTANLEGRLIEVPPLYDVFVVEEPEESMEFLQRIRRSIRRDSF